jgi:hypothetical protein
MGILRIGRLLAAGLTVLAGCYSPGVRDCAVSCASPGECASGQICGSDGLCSAPEMAGHCPSGLPDAAADAPGRDAPSLVPLHVQITGKGSVAVLGRGTCSSLDPQRGDCTFDVPPNVAVTAFAIGLQMNDRFSKWTSTTCGSDNASCTFTPAAATTIVAKFDHIGPAL